MILDSFENLPMYFSMHKDLEKAYEFLKEALAEPKELRRHELNDEGLYANVETYETRYAEGRFPEAHRKYVDLQFIYSGREAIGLAPLADMKEHEAFKEDSDIGFYEGECTQWANLEAKDFAIIWPHEAHLPGTALGDPCQVVKIVVKLPL